MNTIIGVNGIRSDGSSNTDRILLKLCSEHNLNVVDFNYDKVNLIDVYFKLRKSKNKKFEYDIAKQLKNLEAIGKSPPSIVAHSFGCLLTIRALELGMVVNNVYFFSPAVNSDEFINTNSVFGNVYVIHNPNDLAILFGAGLLFHDFGAMGRKGSKFAKSNNKIINIEYNPKFSVKNLIGLNHNVYFENKNINKWIDFIVCKEK